MLLARLPRLLTSTTSSSLPSSYQLLRCPALSPCPPLWQGLHLCTRPSDRRTLGPLARTPGWHCQQGGWHNQVDNRLATNSLSILLNKSIQRLSLLNLLLSPLPLLQVVDAGTCLPDPRLPGGSLRLVRCQLGPH